MIAAIPSAVLVGVDGTPGLRRGPRLQRPSRLHRGRAARCRRARVARPGAGGPAVERPAWPLRRVTVNLAPSGMRKGGAGLDLPIAVGVLVASGALGAGGGRRAWPSSASSVSTARSAGCPGTVVAGRGARRPPAGGARRRAPARPVRPGGRRRGQLAPRRSRALVDRLAGTAWTWPTARRRDRATAERRTPRAAGRPVRPTWPTSAASGWPDGPSRWRRPAVTTCCWWDPRVGQDHAGRPAAGPAPRPRPADRPGGDAGSIGGRRRPCPPGGLVVRPPFRAPHHGASRGGHDRRRDGWMRPGRDQPGPRRRAVPRRDGRVPAPSCSTPCASRSRRAWSGSAGRGVGGPTRPGSCWSAP